MKIEKDERRAGIMVLTWAFEDERVTSVELALSP